MLCYLPHQLRSSHHLTIPSKPQLVASCESLPTCLFSSLHSGKSLEPYFWIPLFRIPPPRHPCFQQGTLSCKGKLASHLAPRLYLLCIYYTRSNSAATHCTIPHHHTLVCRPRHIHIRCSYAGVREVTVSLSTRLCVPSWSLTPSTHSFVQGI